MNLLMSVRWKYTAIYFLAGCACVYLAIFVAIAVLRIGYPYELEWMEGGSVDHVRRILAGLPIYTAPSVEFVPYIYPPLYYYISAGFSLLLGVGLLPLRLVSLLSTIGCFFILFRFARRETGSSAYGFIAAGLYAATFRLCGAWFDIARVDSLFLALLLWAVYLIRFHPHRRMLVVSAILVNLSYFTKQSAVIMVVPLSAYSLFYIGKGLRWIFPAVFLLCAGTVTALLSWSSHGWYYYYVIGLPLQHATSNAMIYYYFSRDIGIRLLIAGCLSLFFISGWRAGRPRWETAFYLLFIFGMVTTSLIGRIHRGGYDNVLMPVCAAFALLFALGINRLFAVDAPPEKTDDRKERWASIRRTTVAYGVIAISIIQFGLLWYSPGAQLPSREDRLDGDLLLKTIKKIDGDVYLPFHGYVATLAGKKTFAHEMAVIDILYSKSDTLKLKLTNEIRDAILGQKFSAIILDQPFFTDLINQRYEYAGPVLPQDDNFWPVTGIRLRPQAIFLARK